MGRSDLDRAFSPRPEGLFLRRSLKRTLAALVIFGVAVSAGYALSARLGPELLRSELEVALSKLLRGKVSIGEVSLVLRGGLRLEGFNLSAYPQGEDGPSLTVRAAFAELNWMSLAVGQLKLDSLRLEGAVFRMEHREDGSWAPYPIAAVANQARANEPLEQQLELLRAFESTTRWLLEEPRLAREVELVDSQVVFLDAHAPPPDGIDAARPYELRLDSVHGRLRHRWISGEADLELRATLANAGGAQGTLEAEGHRRGEQQLRLALAGTAVTLESISPYATSVDGDAYLAGELFGVIAFHTDTPQHSRVELDWVTHELDAVIPLLGTRIPAAGHRGSLDAEIEVHPGRLRLSSAQIRGSEIQLDLSGTAERPLRESARMRLNGDLQGVGLEAARRFIASLPEADRNTLTRILERVEAGHINELGATGSARISDWRKLLSGQLANLPPGFVLDGDIDQVTLEAGESDRLEGVSGRLQWSSDRFEVRGGRGRWNDRALPELDIVVEGASNLFLGTAGSTELRAEASPLLGLDTLIDVLLAEEVEDEAATSDGELTGFPALRLHFERLDHPVFRWRIDDARALLEPTENGAQLNLVAHWAGAPVRAEAVWARAPQDSVSVHVAVGVPGTGPPPEVEPPRWSDAAEPTDGEGASGLAEPRGSPWAFGQFEVASSLDGRFAFKAIGGEFRITGSRLDLTEVLVSLPEQGTVSAFMGAELGVADSAGVEVRFKMTDAAVPVLARAAGISDDVATGTANASGFITGRVRTDAPLLSGLRGAVQFEARQGQVHMKVPLVVAIAQATEGFNPLAERGSVKYETASARLELANSLIRTDHFSMEGPMRIFASGEIDLRAGNRAEIDAVVGVFLFRQADTTLGKVPLLGSLLSDKGLLGAYFEVRGPLEDPEVKALPLSSLAEAVPDVIKAPLRVLGFALRGPKHRSKPPAKPARGAPNAPRSPAPLPPVNSPAADASAEARPKS